MMRLIQVRDDDLFLLWRRMFFCVAGEALSNFKMSTSIWHILNLKKKRALKTFKFKSLLFTI